MPFEITAIDHIVLRAHNPEAMIRFYCEVLGCSLERRNDAIGLIQLRAGSALIDLVPVDSPLGRQGGAGPGTEARNLDHFCLRVKGFDPEAASAKLRRLGVEPGESGDRYGAGGFGPSLYLLDPEGNGIELRAA